MKTTGRSLLVLLTVGLVLLGTAPAARADESAAAVSLFDEGNRLYEAGKYAEACPKYEASLKLDASSIDTRGRLALCYEKTDRLASAWFAWREVKSRASRTSGRERAVDIASSHIAELEPRLARLTLTLAGGAGPAGLVVTLDGTVIPAESFGTPLAVDQGAHRLEAQAPGQKPWSTEVTLANGEKKDVAVGPLTPQPVAAGERGEGGEGTRPPIIEPSAAARPSSTRRWIAIGTLAAGAVALGVGSWAGLDARSKADDARAAGCHDDLSGCPPGPALDTANDAYSRANLSTGFFIAGGALAATGVVLWLTAPSASSPPERTTWRVLPAVGRDGAGVALSGAF